MSFNAAGRLRQIIELLDAAGDDWRTRPGDTENFMSRAYYGLMPIWMGRLDEARQHLHAEMDVANREQGLSMSWMSSGSVDLALLNRSEETRTELQSLMRHSYADFALKNQTKA